MAAQEERERQENVENCQRVAEKRSSDVELVGQAQFESVRCLVESADAFGANLQWMVDGGWRSSTRTDGAYNGPLQFSGRLKDVKTTKQKHHIH